MNKKLFLLLFSASCLAFSACVNNITNEGELTVKNYRDSVANKVKDTGYEVIISIDYPETGNQALINGIREWIFDQTSCAPTTDINNCDSIVKEYVANNLDNIKEIATELSEYGSAQGCSNDIDIKKTFEDDKFITYVNTSYSYMGGAHGSQTKNGVTFRKSDGKVYGYNMLNPTKEDEITKLIEKTLADNLGFDSVDKLKEVLFLPEYSTTVPMPVCDPYLDKDSMVFVYQQYEITPYVMGIPTARIALKDLKPYLSPSFAKYYNTKKEGE